MTKRTTPHAPTTEGHVQKKQKARPTLAAANRASNAMRDEAHKDPLVSKPDSTTPSIPVRNNQASLRPGARSKKVLRFFPKKTTQKKIVSNASDQPSNR